MHTLRFTVFHCLPFIDCFKKQLLIIILYDINVWFLHKKRRLLLLLSITCVTIYWFYALKYCCPLSLSGVFMNHKLHSRFLYLKFFNGFLIAIVMKIYITKCVYVSICVCACVVYVVNQILITEEKRTISTKMNNILSNNIHIKNKSCFIVCRFYSMLVESSFISILPTYKNVNIIFYWIYSNHILSSFFYIYFLQMMIPVRNLSMCYLVEKNQNWPLLIMHTQRWR